VMAEVVTMPGARVISVAMGDHRAIYWPPRINVKLAFGTIQALRAQSQEIIFRAIHLPNMNYAD
jgi:hypothetical protein